MSNQRETPRIGPDGNTATRRGMPFMTRWEFIRRHQGDAVDTESLKHDTALGPDLSDRMIRPIPTPTAPFAVTSFELFSAIDHFDRNGSWHSVSIVPGRGSTTINALASIERASTPRRSDTPSELLARFLTQHPDMKPSRYDQPLPACRRWRLG